MTDSPPQPDSTPQPDLPPQPDSPPKPKFDKFSKEHRWYYKNINGHLFPVARQLLENYSHIPADEIDSHVYKMVPLHPHPPPSPILTQSPLHQLTPPARHPLVLPTLPLHRRIQIPDPQPSPPSQIHAPPLPLTSLPFSNSRPLLP
jgi:hypothetical protein